MNKPDWTYGRDIAGVMRCCLQSLDDAMVDRVTHNLGPPPEGMNVSCKWCGESMTNKDGMFKGTRYVS